MDRRHAAMSGGISISDYSYGSHGHDIEAEQDDYFRSLDRPKFQVRVLGKAGDANAQRVADEMAGIVEDVSK